MKYRKDFVTNSSSSSFIVAFNNKDEGINYFANKIKEDEIFNQVLEDFQNAKSMNIDEVLEYAKKEFLGDTYHILMSKPYKTNRSFCDYIQNKYPNIKYHEIFELPEFKAKQEEIVKKNIESFKKKIQNLKYFVTLSYEDHTMNGSELEHYIMPNLDCTIESFNHH